MSQRRLALPKAAQASAEQHMRAVLDQSHKAELRESALPAAGARTPKGGAVRRGVGHIQARPVQADQPPVAIPRPLAGAGRNGAHYFFIEPPQRRFAQAAARLRDAALA